MAKTAINNPYDAAKVEAIKHYLQMLADHNMPHNYQIVVDDFKAVPKTDKVDMFDTYKAFIGPDTRKLQIRTFIGGSNSNDEHNFYFNASTSSDAQTLNGIEVQKHIDEKVQHALDKKDREYLERKVAELKSELADSKAKIEKLTEDSEALADTYNALKNKNSGLAGFGELVSMMKGFIPGQEQSGPLSGNTRPQQDEPITFTKDTSEAPLSNEAKMYLRFMEDIQYSMDEQQIEDFQYMLNHLKDHPEKIGVIKSLL